MKNNIESKKQNIRKKILRIDAVILSIAIVTLSFSAASVSCNTNTTLAEGENQTALSAGPVSQSPDEESEINKSITALTELSQDIPEPLETWPRIGQIHSFANNTKRFSDKVRKNLDKTLTSEFIALYDVTADEFVYLKNASKKCYPASTTKILTAITASTIITDPDTVITVGDEINMIGEESSVAGLEKGMQLTFEMLLDALLLPSGNDAAYTIAVNCGRIYADNDKLDNKAAVKVFMECVNKVAKRLGTDQTHYTTPDGWHDDDHYTSASDLAKIADYARTITVVRNSFSKPYAKWKLVKGGTLEWYNTNRLILQDSGNYSPYCDGIKTGFTDQAGTSVVASATMNGHTFIAVVMNGQTLYAKYDDCNILFKNAFDLYGYKYTYENQ